MVCLAQYKTEATEHALTPRAVAIPALGWRLRVEPTQTRRFETTLHWAHHSASWTVAATDDRPCLNLCAFTALREIFLYLGLSASS
jgi:hypothetical protein